MNIFLTIVIFYIGAALGSFLSVLIYRTRHGLSGIVAGRSTCPYCKKQLIAIDLLPIVNYLILRGRCRHCKEKIAPHYLLLELITGLTLGALYLKFPFLTYLNEAPYMNFDLQLLWDFARYALVSIMLMAIFFYDLLYKEIPDMYSYFAIIIVVAGNIYTGTPALTEFIIGGAVGAIFFLAQILVSKGKWVGSGDVILGMLMGLMLGWKQLLIALFISYVIGAIISIWLLAAKKATKKTQIPFAPFLVTGTILTILFGNLILDWYQYNFLAL